MRHTFIAGIAALGVLFTFSHAAAQRFEGFATGGLHRDVNREQFAGLGGGVLLTTVRWLTVGGQADAFLSPPYVAGRGTILLQGNVVTVGGVRPFVLIGKSFGEMDGPMYGAGVDCRPPNARVGVRATVQAYLADRWLEPERVVQPSVNVGVIWGR
jgi:hypothetical protein